MMARAAKVPPAGIVDEVADRIVGYLKRYDAAPFRVLGVNGDPSRLAANLSMSSAPEAASRASASRDVRAASIV